MIIGHGLVAFILTAIILIKFSNLCNKSILYLATTTGIAAIIPDIDMLLPLASIFTVNTLSITAITDQFWSVSGERHRLATHSLIILTITTLIAFSIQKISETTAFKPKLKKPKQKIATILTTIIIIFTPLSIPLKLLTTTTIITAYILIQYKPKNITTTQLTIAFLFGSLTHPFGDMFTGTPPTFLYPYTNIIELSRWTLPNPTLQLTLLFILEIGSLILTFLIQYKPKNITTTQLTIAFLFGSLTHPFGDMFTGTPPTFLYPYTNIIELSRWTLPNPTLQLTLLFILEIGSLILTFLILEKLTTTHYLTYEKIKPQTKHIIFGTINIILIYLLAQYYTIPLTPTVDTANKFVLTIVTITLLTNTKTIYNKQYAKYITNVSWTLLFTITIFTILYTINNYHIL
jgi:hypothetical protein